MKVQILKLSNGDQIICQVKKIDNYAAIVRSPIEISLNMQEDGEILTIAEDWVIAYDKLSDIPIPAEFIMAYVTPSSEHIQIYDDMVNGVEVDDSKLFFKPNSKKKLDWSLNPFKKH